MCDLDIGQYNFEQDNKEQWSLSKYVPVLDTVWFEIALSIFFGVTNMKQLEFLIVLYPELGMVLFKCG